MLCNRAIDYYYDIKGVCGITLGRKIDDPPSTPVEKKHELFEHIMWFIVADGPGPDRNATYRELIRRRTTELPLKEKLYTQLVNEVYRNN